MAFSNYSTHAKRTPELLKMFNDIPKRLWFDIAVELAMTVTQRSFSPDAPEVIELLNKVKDRITHERKTCKS